VTPERRQRLLLAGLGVSLLLAAVVYLPPLFRVSGDDDLYAPPPAGAARRPEAREARSALAIPEVTALRLGRLEVEPFAFAIGRDPFRYGPAPPPPPPPPPPPVDFEALERARREAEERARAAAVDAARPKPPPVDIVYLGSFGPARNRVAVFSDQEKQEVFNARRGEVLAGKFILVEIGLESVSLKFVGFPDHPAQRLGIGS